MKKPILAQGLERTVLLPAFELGNDHEISFMRFHGNENRGRERWAYYYEQGRFVCFDTRITYPKISTDFFSDTSFPDSIDNIFPLPRYPCGDNSVDYTALLIEGPRKCKHLIRMNDASIDLVKTQSYCVWEHDGNILPQEVFHHEWHGTELRTVRTIEELILASRKGKGLMYAEQIRRGIRDEIVTRYEGIITIDYEVCNYHDDHDDGLCVRMNKYIVGAPFPYMPTPLPLEKLEPVYQDLYHRALEGYKFSYNPQRVPPSHSS